ncbi:23S rRNA (adenine(2030)-N(6))-methyltransferase RlmJ [Aureimonas jatrophae]|uniref:Ribosomal RNA large subunit methyltransferase J n=1 Tax=Aureimonas jatrophae TaxID=1166073 RepID=A0A1H0GB51_9HYPH|nr:23S rRNA (adenine(2030)-N(6))-methyltransferase RlmJ [Aureimonas jatrophae]MBB3949494.1 23S rRNA (adenine2030-N6)-methyltransferase [Aureimonas jatrophae]SDO04117.1 23S rRNA (adenine2030-N6)-methyltransferase [Aureimonas jatrophae]
MNYRHAFHAGNFADVVKHALLARLVEYLKLKPKAFRILDTHAGIGRYDLAGDESNRTGERRSGIDRVVDSSVWDDPLLRPYRLAVEAVRERHGADSYPGSPLVARALMRPQDRLSAYELHPTDAEMLHDEFAGDHQVRVIHLDGWLALGAHLPPKEKRGIVLIDPPFEEVGEHERIVERVVAAAKRWPGGTYAVWYPIKQRERRHALLSGFRDSGLRNIATAELLREPVGADERLVGTGFLVVNPPWTFVPEAERLLNLLRPLLETDRSGSTSVEMLVPE